MPCLVVPCPALPGQALHGREAWAFGSRTRTKTISPTAPESAHALPRHAKPRRAWSCPAWTGPVRARGWSRTTHTTIRATSYICSPMPCPAEPCHAPQSRALTCTAQGVRAPDSNRRVCHPRYRSKEPKPCHARHGRATACRVVPNHATRCLAASVRGQGVEPRLRPSTPPTQEACSSLSKRSFNAATSASV